MPDSGGRAGSAAKAESAYAAMLAELGLEAADPARPPESGMAS